MTISATISLFGVLLVLAAIPSASVMLVVSRSALHGTANGAAVSLGIVLGDLIFVALALLGMSFLAEVMGAFFVIIKYVAGTYLLWFGYTLLRSGEKVKIVGNGTSSRSLFTSFSAGLLLTLGDVKAILFYASLFPAFVDLSRVSAQSVALICLVTIVAVGGVKLFYAYLAHRIMCRLQSEKTRRITRSGAGICMLGAGVYLIVKA